MTRFVERRGRRIAYALDEGAGVPVLVLPGFLSHLEHDRLLHHDPGGLRLLRVDLPGMGLADRADGLPPFEERVDDLVAVLDDAGVERAVVLGRGGGGPLALLLAAVHPQRVAGLVLWSTAACWSPDDGAPMEAEALTRFIRSSWGTGNVARMLQWDAPDDTALLARYEHDVTSADVAVAAVREVLEIDCGVALPVIAARTLVVKDPRDPLVRAGAADQLVRGIARATMLERPGDDEVRAFVDRLEAPPADAPSLRVAAVVDVIGDGSEQRHEATFTGPCAALAWTSSFDGRHVRAALHAGPVPGPTVDVAARLAASAAPGDRLVTDEVIGLGVRGQELGRRRVWGLPDPLRVWRVSR